MMSITAYNHLPVVLCATPQHAEVGDWIVVLHCIVTVTESEGDQVEPVESTSLTALAHLTETWRSVQTHDHQSLMQGSL